MKNCHQYNYVKCCVFWDVSCSKLLIDRKPHKTEIEILAMLGTLNRVWKKKHRSGTIRLVQYPLSPPLSSADVNEARDWVLMSASFDPKWRIQSDLCTVLHLHKRHHHKSGIVCLYGSSYYVLCFQNFQSGTLICIVSSGNRLLRECLLLSPALGLQVQAPLRRKFDLTYFYNESLMMLLLRLLVCVFCKRRQEDFMEVWWPKKTKKSSYIIGLCTRAPLEISHN